MDYNHELKLLEKTQDENQKVGSSLEHQSNYDGDRDTSARLGKKQVLKVRTSS